MAAFLLEVGTEELPTAFVQGALAQWQNDIAASLAEWGFADSTIRLLGTPRRLAVLIENLPAQQADREEAIKGPPESVAYDAQGALTQAALGFARKQGVDASELELRPVGKGQFLFARKQIMGQATPALLQTAIPAWITGLKGDRLMRWGSGELKFPRPIRWLVCLWDADILPVELENVTSDRETWVHRVLHPAPLSISSASTYAACLQQGYVMADREQRKATIRQQVEAVATSVQGVAMTNEALLDEVTDLVEWPTAVLGHFEPEFLVLPAPVIETVMVTHQRYFSVRKADGSLLPYFITISNGDPAKSAAIAAGNGRVIRARLADGQFFYSEDRKLPLVERLPKLAAVTFAENLGSMADKVDRIRAITAQIAQALGLDSPDLDRTAQLCKADLVSQMVYEFPEMQGIMGADYARHHGESEAVAVGIEQHYWPLGAGAALPTAITAQVVGIADRLDSLVGLFHQGKIPSGSSDRFALRRAANSIVLILAQAGLSLDLEALLSQLCDTYADANTAQLLREFFSQRLQVILQDDVQIDYDLVNALLADAALVSRALQNIPDLWARAQLLQALRQSGELAELYPSVNRIAKLTKEVVLSELNPAAVFEPTLVQDASETALFEAAQAVYTQAKTGDYRVLVEALLAAGPAVTTFFEAVLVMDPDLKLRQNRLHLLAVLRNNARLLADFGTIIA